MITSIDVRNFKSLRKTGKLELAPVNLICGVNNSGKSSLLQSLLVLKQTLASPSAEEPLIMNGPLVALGNYQDVHHFGAGKDEPLELGVSVAFPSQERMSQWWGALERKHGSRLRRSGMWANRAYSKPWEPEQNGFSMDVLVSLGRDRAHRGNHLLLSTQMEITAENGWFSPFRFRLDRDPDILSRLRTQFRIDDSQFLFGESVFAVTRCEPTRNRWDRPVACMLRNFLPWNGVLIDPSDSFDAVYEVLESLIPEREADLIMLRREGERSFRTRSGAIEAAPRDTLENILWTALKRYPTAIRQVMMQRVTPEKLADIQDRLDNLTVRTPLITKRLTLPIPAKDVATGRLDFDDAVTEFQDFFTQHVFYLGPLRDEPRAFYRRIGSPDPLYVGERGENSAFVLKYYGQRDVAFIKPPETGVEWNPNTEEIAMKPLIQAVVSWLQYLRVAKDIDVQDIGKIGLAVRASVYGGKDYSDLTNVGVGVSQVLPLIVLGLVAPPGSTLLLEQPELHLHPYVQSRLADFFLSLRAVGKQVIAETHSEHLVYRMRYFMAKQTINSSDLSVYFFALPTDEKQTVVKPIHITSYGEIDEWPEDFFDETTKLLNDIVDASFARIHEGGDPQ